MVLIQMLLPTSGAVNGEDLAPLAETRRELAERFNGLTAYLRSPAKGWWTAPDGHAEQDDVVMVEVVTDTFDRAWWRAYATTLAARLARRAFTCEPWPWTCWTRTINEHTGKARAPGFEAPMAARPNEARLSKVMRQLSMPEAVAMAVA